MSFAKRLKQYSALLYPGRGRQSGRINLYCGEYKLYLRFLDPSDDMSEDYYDAAAKTGVAYQPFSQYQFFLDLIRNEKPIWVTFNPENDPPSFVVYSGREPPGEGELFG